MKGKSISIGTRRSNARDNSNLSGLLGFDSNANSIIRQHSHIFTLMYLTTE